MAVINRAVLMASMPDRPIARRHAEVVNELVEELRTAVRQGRFTMAVEIEQTLDYVVNHPVEYA